MPSGFKVNSVDLDEILKTRSSAKRADVGLAVAGVDISNLYELSAGGDQIAGNTGYKSGGADLKTLFRDINHTPGAALSATVDNNAPSASGTGSGPFTTPNVMVTPAGGTPGYTYAWARLSGDATISISSTTVANPNWSASGTAQQTKSAVWRCTVTDTVPNTTTVDVTVTITFNTAALSVTLDKASVYGLRTGTGSGAATTEAVTATPSGGTAPYTYLWERVSGDASTSANSGTSATTTFSRTGSPNNFYNSTWRCKVTDNVGNIAYSADLPVTLEFDSGI